MPQGKENFKTQIFNNKIIMTNFYNQNKTKIGLNSINRIFLDNK